MSKPPRKKIHLNLTLVLTVSLLVLLALLFTSQNKLLITPVLKTSQISLPQTILPKTPTPIPTLTPTPTPKPIYKPLASGYQIRVPILMYHYLSNNPNPEDKQRDNLSVSPDNFEEQLKYLQENGYHTTSFDTLFAALKKQTTLPSKTVLLTFDDGYIDFYINAYPILKKYNIHATVFIPTALMNQGYYLSWNQIKEMYSSGLVHFGTHTSRHTHLPSISQATMITELVESKNTLQNALGIPVNFIAYPYGAVNENVIEQVKKAGYMGAIGTWPGVYQSEGTIFDMPRLKVGGSYNLEQFKKLL